jgi:hypothetical protein
MATHSRVTAFLLLIFALSSILIAREQTATGIRTSPVTIAADEGEKVRFASPGPTAQIRVQVLSANGDAIFDSAWKDGNVLDWSGGSLADGTYGCVVLVRDLEGNVTQKESTMTARGGKVSIEDVVGAEPKVTLLAHDGATGSIVSTEGDLSFRFGNFLAAKDAERMQTPGWYARSTTEDRVESHIENASRSASPRQASDTKATRPSGAWFGAE